MIRRTVWETALEIVMSQKRLDEVEKILQSEILPHMGDLDENPATVVQRHIDSALSSEDGEEILATIPLAEEFAEVMRRRERELDEGTHLGKAITHIHEWLTEESFSPEELPPLDDRTKTLLTSMGRDPNDVSNWSLAFNAAWIRRDKILTLVLLLYLLKCIRASLTKAELSAPPREPEDVEPQVSDDPEEPDDLEEPEE